MPDASSTYNPIYKTQFQVVINGVMGEHIYLNCSKEQAERFYREEWERQDAAMCSL